MSKLEVVKELGRPTAALLYAAVATAVGGVVALGLALAWAEELRQGGIVVGAILLLGGVLGCGLWLLPTHVLALVCGWSLGWPMGTAVAVAGATLGSPLGYWAGGKLAGSGALVWVERYPRGAAVCRAITRASAWRAGWLVGLLRLSPVVPYGATNVLAASFKLRWWPFVWGTLLGMAPRAAAVAGLGAGLERLEMSKPGGWGWVILGVAATVLMIASLGWVTHRALRQFDGSEVVEGADPEDRLEDNGSAAGASSAAVVANSRGVVNSEA